MRSPEQQRQQMLLPLEGTQEYRERIAYRHLPFAQRILENNLGIVMSTIERVMLRHAIEKVLRQYAITTDPEFDFYGEVAGNFVEEAFGLDFVTVRAELLRNRELFKEFMRRWHDTLHNEV